MNVNDYDLTSGFVLNNEQALDYLEACAKGFYNEAVNLTGDDIGAIIDDIVAMAHIVRVEWREYEWVKFEECQMAPSGIMIKPMVERSNTNDTSIRGDSL